MHLATALAARNTGEIWTSCVGGPDERWVGKLALPSHLLTSEWAPPSPLAVGPGSLSSFFFATAIVGGDREHGGKEERERDAADRERKAASERVRSDRTGGRYQSQTKKWWFFETLARKVVVLCYLLYQVVSKRSLNLFALH